jgi:AmmeMemoRadiSam system protein A
MNDAQKKQLLEIARDTIRAVVAGKPFSKPQSEDSSLTALCGCFVTLKNCGRLRGCIGQFVSDRPLVELVAEMAKASATSDPRFLTNPIRSGEVSKLDVEISVLSPLQRVDNPLSLELGRHGIYIKKGYACGCFLPQVADETGWSKEEFLSYCCSHKAGLAPDAWKDPKTEVYLFTAEVFGAALHEI